VPTLKKDSYNRNTSSDFRLASALFVVSANGVGKYRITAWTVRPD
jgi:hypothetical protein